MAPEDGSGGGGTAAVVASVLLSLALIGTAGALYVTRKELMELRDTRRGETGGRREAPARVEMTSTSTPPVSEGSPAVSYRQVEDGTGAEGEGERLV